ncbi:multidrug effflux MFS transporter [Dysgonomonas sp. 520]|uniref:multidrug effflux MFS transporter n=1 Tax=Dysgonomonas sp. 520 TaxID=2302931 RepID=UPI0013D833CD|nr:multidrug effflux MFS transporter [Dysgonomonas sp. 520]NDW09734.1 Bcr/CflA family efflux MFS transporter [Dysgonomonas sp. 520]
MKGFTFSQWMVIIILSLLTALEPLSIDLYLPGFILISETFSTTNAAVQVSLSTFLAGFAVGQLFWGPVSDRFGRKIPTLVSLAIFIVATVACLFVTSIEQLWVARFIQALGGCGGVVISRAIVTDYFDKTKTLKIFTILALIMGIAPIMAPLIGNVVLGFSSWRGLFGTMLTMGVVMMFLTLFFLPETHKSVPAKIKKNVFATYWSILKVRQFTFYALIAGLANGALMLYVGNAPFVIMEHGGLSGDVFSIVFATNAAGLMISSWLTGYLQRYFSTRRITRYAIIFMFVASVILFLVIKMDAGIYTILAVLFFYIFPIGALFPTTTELAMTPFADNSGSASALFGSIQLLVACLCTVCAGAISDGSILSVGLSFLLCGLLMFSFVLKRKEATQPISSNF